MFRLQIKYKKMKISINVYKSLGSLFELLFRNEHQIY